MQYKDLFEYNTQKRDFLHQITEPLKDNFEFNFIGYRRFCLRENKLLYLIPNKHWCNVVFTNKYWMSQAFPSLIKNINPRGFFFNIWPDLPDSSDPVYGQLYENNIWNGIVLYVKLEDCIETFCFAGDKGSYVVKNFLINNIQLLEDFVHYFKFKMNDLLHKIDSRMCINIEESFFSVDSSHNELALKIDKYSNEVDVKRYFMRIEGRDSFLTKREKQCLGSLSKNQSIKEVARTLNLSPRTIEYYINRIKIKTGCTGTSELIKIYCQQIERIYGGIQ